MRIILLLALAVSIAGCGSDQSPSGPCTFSVSASPQSFSVGGGTGSATISTASRCSWTARADANWLSITAGNSGSGQGVVSFTVAPSSDASARSGHLIIADQTVSIAQDGLVVCQYTVEPVKAAYCVDTVQGAIAVYTTTGCPWSASTDAQWITLLNSPTSGSDTLRFNVASNYLAPGRESVIKIRWPTAPGQDVQVSQSGCMYGVGPSSLNFGSAGGAGQFDVVQQTTPDYTCGGALQNACVWTAQANVSWISITTSMPQKGDNPVRFTVAANDGSTQRVGTITVADNKVVTITQAGR